MFRNLVFGTLLAPLGAALPVAAIFIGWGVVSGVWTQDMLAMSNGFGIAFYVLAGAFIFGWLTALLIGFGNGLVWVLVKERRRRLWFAWPVGFAATLIGLYPMVPFALRDMQALLALILYATLGSIGSSFSAAIIARASGSAAGAPT